jgi:hypothetical protein
MNSVQPILSAGRSISHPQEHEAIVRLLKKIVRETGLAARWRIVDLLEY